MQRIRKVALPKKYQVTFKSNGKAYEVKYFDLYQDAIEYMICNGYDAMEAWEGIIF